MSVQRKQPQESQAAQGHRDNRHLCQVQVGLDVQLPIHTNLSLPKDDPKKSAVQKFNQ